MTARRGRLRAVLLDRARAEKYSIWAAKAAYPGVAQLAARVVWDHQAAGSNPVTRTAKKDTPKGVSFFAGGRTCGLCCAERIIMIYYM